MLSLSTARCSFFRPGMVTIPVGYTFLDQPRQQQQEIVWASKQNCGPIISKWHCLNFEAPKVVACCIFVAKKIVATPKAEKLLHCPLTRREKALAQLWEQTGKYSFYLDSMADLFCKHISRGFWNRTPEFRMRLQESSSYQETGHRCLGRIYRRSSVEVIPRSHP